MTESIQIGDRLLVLFDGQCGLCNHAVQWFVRRDRWDRLRFAPSGSAKVAELIEPHGIIEAGSEMGLETILVVRDPGRPSERVLLRSEAVLTLLSELPQPWLAIGAALGWIPRPVLDLAYRQVARWRYRIWGRLESCPLPTAEERTRFL
jgi:predicted DCC family thiol-disulfide oxidoreductase YuxK